MGRCSVAFIVRYRTPAGRRRTWRRHPGAAPGRRVRSPCAHWGLRRSARRGSTRGGGGASSRGSEGESIRRARWHARVHRGSLRLVGPGRAADTSSGDRPVYGRDRRKPAHYPLVRLRHARGLACSWALGFIQAPDAVEEIVRDVAWVVGSLALGSAVASRRAYVEQIRQRAIDAERTKEEEAQRRVEEERIRIARDVHDGVAHALASISIQAGAGGAVLDSDPEGARQAFKAIRAASALALSELRSTLGMLRHQPRAPRSGGFQPEQVDRLAEVLRAEGIRVSVHGEASAQPVEGEVGTAIHRILQEALTNVLRHSRAERGGHSSRSHGR